MMADDLLDQINGDDKKVASEAMLKAVKQSRKLMEMRDSLVENLNKKLRRESPLPATLEDAEKQQKDLEEAAHKSVNIPPPTEKPQV